MNNKERFCLYLEEVAAELRALSSTKEYLFDIVQSLIDHSILFEKRELEDNRIRGIEDSEDE